MADQPGPRSIERRPSWVDHVTSIDDPHAESISWAASAGDGGGSPVLHDRSSPPPRDVTQRTRTARRTGRVPRLVATVVALGVVAACGSTDTSGPSSSIAASPLPSVLDGAASSAPRADGRLPLGSPPPTTTPVSVPPLSCSESVVTIAERLLIERRQRTPSTSCIAVGALPSGAPSGPPCWDRCADGRSFADFVLDTDAPSTEVPAPSDGASVRYVARYVDEEGVESSVAETLSFEPNDDRPGVQLTAVSSTDLSAQEAELSSLLDAYFAALDSNDFASAALLLVGSGSVPAPNPGTVAGDERADLGRLVDEGLLASDWDDGGAGRTAAVAAAVEEWCRGGAICRSPDQLRAEVTPRHTVRAIATYDIDDRSFDTVFRVADEGGTVIGLPPRP